MDQHKYTTLVEALAEVPDPRKRRGQRYPRIFLLTFVAAALASGQRHGRAIGQLVQEHAEPLRQALDWRGRALPSEATVRRVLRHIDLVALEDRLRHLGEPLPTAPAPPQWKGVALDGKELRGARARPVGTRASCTSSAWSVMTRTQGVPRWLDRRRTPGR